MAILRQYFSPYILPQPAQVLPKINPQQQQQQQQSQYSAYYQPQPQQAPQYEQPSYNTQAALQQEFANIQQEQQTAFRPTPAANNPLAVAGTNPVTNFISTSRAVPDFQTYYNQLQGITDIGASATMAAQAQAAARAKSLTDSLSSFDVSGTGNGQAAEIAKSLIGIPYVWGGIDKNGLDCSGLVYLVLNKSGIKVPRLLASQYGRMGQAVSLSQAQPGDVVYYDEPGSTDHVGIYIGGGKMIDAPYTGARVRVDNVGNFTSIRRIGTPATGTTPMGINAGLGGTKAQNAALGKQLVIQGGLGSQWNSFNKLIMSESGWDNKAKNPNSTAYGIGQFLNSTWNSFGPKTSDPRTQILYTIKYAIGRYGSLDNAWKFKQTHGWY